jgi:hypothetical protein
MEPSKTWTALAALVLLHFVVTLGHAWAHAAAAVRLGPAALGFVLLVIVIGPLAGLAVARRSARIGAVLIAVTMLGALLFGIVNHFLLAGPDRVDHVGAQWRTWFATTAALLAITEAGAGTLAIASLLAYRRGGAGVGRETGAGV